MTTSMPTSETSNPTAEFVEMSSSQPAWHVVVLSMLTFSTYLVYWFYKTVKALKSRAEAAYGSGATPGPNCEGALGKYKNANPSLTTLLLFAPTLFGLFFYPLLVLKVVSAEQASVVGLLIPLVTLGFFALLYHDIATLGKEGSMLKANPSFPAFVLVVAMVFFWNLTKLPEPFFLLFTLVAIPPAIAQHWLNDYWTRVEPESSLVRKSFSKWEMLVMLIGSLALSLVVVGGSIH